MIAYGERKMPFTKRSDGKYTSPSGKVWTKKQMKGYYTNKNKESKKK